SPPAADRATPVPCKLAKRRLGRTRRRVDGIAAAPCPERQIPRRSGELVGERRLAAGTCVRTPSSVVPAKPPRLGEHRANNRVAPAFRDAFELGVGTLEQSRG